MHNEFGIVFELVLGFFLETIIVLVILIRLDQPRDHTKPADDRHGERSGDPGPRAPSIQAQHGQQIHQHRHLGVSSTSANQLADTLPSQATGTH